MALLIIRRLVLRVGEVAVLVPNHEVRAVRDDGGAGWRLVGGTFGAGLTGRARLLGREEPVGAGGTPEGARLGGDGVHFARLAPLRAVHVAVEAGLALQAPLLSLLVLVEPVQTRLTLYSTRGTEVAYRTHLTLGQPVSVGVVAGRTQHADHIII